MPLGPSRCKAFGLAPGGFTLAGEGLGVAREGQRLARKVETLAGEARPCAGEGGELGVRWWWGGAGSPPPARGRMPRAISAYADRRVGWGATWPGGAGQ